MRKIDYFLDELDNNPELILDQFTCAECGDRFTTEQIAENNFEVFDIQQYIDEDFCENIDATIYHKKCGYDSHK